MGLLPWNSIAKSVQYTATQLILNFVDFIHFSSKKKKSTIKKESRDFSNLILDFFSLEL